MLIHNSVIVCLFQIHNIDMRFLEIFTSIGGAIGTVILITAATAEGGSIVCWGNMSAALFHFAVMIIMLPFLFLSIFRGPIISKWFATFVRIGSLINAVLMLLLIRFVEENIELFIVAAILELLPWLLLRIKRDKIGVYEYGYYEDE